MSKRIQLPWEQASGSIPGEVIEARGASIRLRIIAECKFLDVELLSIETESSIRVYNPVAWVLRSSSTNIQFRALYSAETKEGDGFPAFLSRTGHWDIEDRRRFIRAEDKRAYVWSEHQTTVHVRPISQGLLPHLVPLLDEIDELMQAGCPVRPLAIARPNDYALRIGLFTTYGMLDLEYHSDEFESPKAESWLERFSLLLDTAPTVADEILPGRVRYSYRQSILRNSN